MIKSIESTQAPAKDSECSNVIINKTSLSPFLDYNIPQTKQLYKDATWWSNIDKAYDFLYKEAKYAYDIEGPFIVLGQDINYGCKPEDAVKRYNVVPYTRNMPNYFMKNDFHLYEILPGNLPRYFYTDIDVKPSDDIYGKYSNAELIEFIKQPIKLALQALGLQSINIDDNSSVSIYCTCNQNLQSKQSIHCIFPFALKNITDQRYFVSILKYFCKHPDTDDKINKDLKKILDVIFDFSPYGVNQNFRLPGNSKIYKDNPLVGGCPHELSQNIDNGSPKSAKYKFFCGIYEEELDDSHEPTVFIDSQLVQQIAMQLCAKLWGAPQALLRKEHKTLMPLLQSGHTRKSSRESSNGINGAIQQLTASNWNVLDQLCSYEPSEIPAPDYAITNPTIFYVMAIPNLASKPQPWVVWYSIGQALYNTSAASNLSNMQKPEHNVYLKTWIDWSNRAAAKYGDETVACQYQWSTFDKRTAGYGINFLTNVCKLYHSEETLQKYNHTRAFNDFFDYSPYLRGFRRRVPPRHDGRSDSDGRNPPSTSRDEEDLHFWQVPPCHDGMNVSKKSLPKKHDIFAYTETYHTRYVQPVDHNKHDICVIESAMGTGKTVCVSHTIGKMLQEHHSLFPKDCKQYFSYTTQKPRAFRALIVSPRQAFSREKVADFKKQLTKLVDYNDDVVQSSYSWGEFDQLAIQVESLHRLEYADPYDLVILDEIESILYQFHSTTNKNPVTSFSAFINIIMESKKVIMADAFITNRTVCLCADIHKMNSCKKIAFYKNTFNPYKHIKTQFISVAPSLNKIAITKLRFIQHVCDLISAGKKIYVVIASKAFKDQLIAEVKTQCQLVDNDIIGYDRETDEATIKALANVKEVWAQDNIRMVITTTKLTVGINFDVPDIFNCVCIYGSSKCPIVRDLIQGHFRVRHTIDKVVYVAVNAAPVPESYAWTTKNIHSGLASSIVNGARHHTPLSTDITVDDDPMMAAKMVMYDHIGQYNLLEERIGYADYFKVLKHFLTQVGYTLLEYKEKSNEDDKKQQNQQETRLEGAQPFLDFSYLMDIKCTDYHKIKDKKNKTASEKRICQAMYFYNKFSSIIKISQNTDTFKNCILESGLPDPDKYLEYLQSIVDKYPDHLKNIKEAFELDIYSKFSTDKSIAKRMESIYMELYTSTSTKRMTERHNKAVLQEQMRLVVCGIIKEICGILGITSSIDVKSIVKLDNLKAFKKWFNELESDKKTLLFDYFLIRDKINKENRMMDEKFDINIVKTIINEIFKTWSGLQLENTQVANNIDKKARTYTYHLVPLTNKEKSKEIPNNDFMKRTDLYVFSFA